MTNLFSRIKQSRLYPILVLEDLVSRRLRRALRFLIEISILILLLTLSQSARWLGLALTLASLGVFLHLVEAFFRSYYFSSIITNDYRSSDLFTFTVGRVLYQVRDNNILKSFMLSETGGLVLRRLGISEEHIRSFLEMNKVASTPELNLSSSQPLTLRQLADWLYTNHEAFAKFLFRFQVGAGELAGAVDWVVRDIETRARQERWWSRESLSRVAGIAKDWSYGHTATLSRYAEDLLASPQTINFSDLVSFRSEEMKQLENVLLRNAEANALLVGPAGEGKMDVVWELVNNIKFGRVDPKLEPRRPTLFHVALFLADCREQKSFESTILKVFHEARRAGNIILVIDDLSLLLNGANQLGVRLSALLSPFLVSPDLPIIALANTESVENHSGLWLEIMRRFEQVKVLEVNTDRLIIFLQEKCLRYEKEAKLFFTYQALKEIANSAERYFQNETVADRALDILIEIVPWAVASDHTIIGREEVLAFVSSKTQIPLGKVGALERDLLLQLEANLGKQVVGQKEAISGISRALRRKRSGIQNTSRPIGSFLFLGPTGVGKTETAKTLARTLFGNEDALLRLDMSEYQSGEALSRLIGSFSDNKPGVLANLLRQNPYGVLLLDEFEKTTADVLNLFLQILDEGFFSDAFGRRVNARNIIFLATSNAGANLIWQMVKEGKDPAGSKSEIVNHLVQAGTFRPELLNRFDEVIIFHPLSSDELRSVAKLQLERLAGRLKAQGLALQIDYNLINRVVALGSDPLFGARPMNRFIQDHIEQAVADAIVAGKLPAGSSLRFNGGNLEIVN